MLLVLALMPSAWADQQSGRTVWTETDGAPAPEPCFQITASNGTLTNTGGDCALTTGAGGGAGDIEGVTAGTGLTGGGTTGTVTLNAIGTANEVEVSADAIGLPDAVIVTTSLTVGSAGTERITFTTGGEYLDGSTDDFLLFQGVSGADNTDLLLDLDGTRPVLSSPTDTVVEVAEDLFLTGVGPDWRVCPTGGDCIHFGAEFATATGTIWFLSNATDGTHLMLGDNADRLYFPRLFAVEGGGCLVLGSNGRVTSETCGGGAGTVMSVDSGDGLTGGPITSTGSLAVGAGTGLDVTADAVDFDSTEIGTTTWGSGSGFTWTMNAGTCDPTIATSDKSLVLACAGGSNNENLTLDFDTTSNRVLVNSGSGARLKFDVGPLFADDVPFFIGDGSDSSFSWETTGNDNLQLGLIVNSVSGSGFVNVMEFADIGVANRSPLAVTTNPTLRLYSADANEAVDYLQLSHDQTNAVIEVGNGDLVLLGDVEVQDASPHFSFNPDAGDSYGFHTDPTNSVFFLANETDSTHLLRFLGDGRIQTPTLVNCSSIGTTADGTLGCRTAGSGTVTSLTAGTGLTGGVITTSGTIALETPVAVANGGTGAAALTNLITLGTHTTGNYVADLTAGTYIDVSGGGSETSTVTVTVDATEMEAVTFGAGGNASNAWTFDLSGTDPVLTAASGEFQSSGDLQVSQASPHLELRDTTDNVAYLLEADTANAYPNLSLWRGTNSGSGFSITPARPLLQFDNSNDLRYPLMGFTYGPGQLTLTTSGVVKPLLDTKTLVIENLAAADDNLPIGPGRNAASTVRYVGCKCHGTCTTRAILNLEDDGGNALTIPGLNCVAAPTAMTFHAVTGAGGLTAGESLRLDVLNTPSPETDEYEISTLSSIDS